MAAIAGQIELGQPSMSALSAPPSGPAPDGGSAVAPRFLEEQSRFQAFLDIRLAPVEELRSPARPGLRRIGVGRSIPEPYRGAVAESLVWTTNGDGDLFTTFQITSPDAKALRVAILATLPVNATLRFHAVAAEGAGNPPSRQYTAADFQLQVSESATSREPMVIERPAYAHQVVNDRPTVWSPIMRGDAVGVEIVLPLGTSIPDFSLAVVGVSHLYTLPTDVLSRADAARACEPIDAMCSRARRCTLDAALRLTYTTPQGESYSCSATAVNDSRSMEEKLAAPSVLTAHHCISAAYDVETVVGNWHQRTTDCDSGTTTNRYVELKNGAELIATHAESDHTLLRMRDPVPTAGGYCLAAWSTADDLVGRAVTSIHHGATGFKEWVEGHVEEEVDFSFDDGKAVHGYQLNLEDGVTWDGSAGAGWFDERDGESHYVAVQSRTSQGDCTSLVAGSFRDFFDAVGRGHLVGPGAGGVDHGDTTETATVLSLDASGTSFTVGTIGSEDDVDVFRVNVPIAGTLTAYTQSSIDTVGQLLAEDGTEIAADDDGGAGDNFRIVEDVTEGAYFIRVRSFEQATGDYTLVVALSEHAVPRELTYSIPLFLPDGDASREGFLRIINASDRDGVVHLTAIDDRGTPYGPVALTLGERETVHLNSRDLEQGNASKGLSTGVGDGDGNWRLLLQSSLAVNPLAYVRTTDGFVTSMHDVAGHASRSHRIVFFNPGSNVDQRSLLRLINPTPAPINVTIRSRDSEGRRAPLGDVRLALPASSSISLTSRQLEGGAASTTGRLGDGVGKWELSVEADGDILAMSLLETPTGHLTNLSTISRSDSVPLFLPAGPAREGFLRVVNNSDVAGTVSITGTDATGTMRGPITFSLAPLAAKHMNSGDLEGGNDTKGLAGSLGDGTGSWRLQFSSALDITAQAYVRTADGFVTSMHEQVPRTGLTHDVAFFNPASNINQRSWLQLANLGSRSVAVAIEAVDDAGESGLRPVTLSLDSGEVRTLTAQALETGDPSFNGRFGVGVGKWQLAISAAGEIGVLNLLETPTGHLTNLSTEAEKPFAQAFSHSFIEPGESEKVLLGGREVEAALNQILVFLDADVTSTELRNVQAAIADGNGTIFALDTDLRTIQVGFGDDVEEGALIKAVAALAGVSSANVNAVVAPDGVAFVENGDGYQRWLRANPTTDTANGRVADVSDRGPVGTVQQVAAFPGDYWIEHVNAERAWQTLVGSTLYRSTIGIVDTGLARSQAVIEESRVRRYRAGGSSAAGDFSTSRHGLQVTGFAVGAHAGEQRGVNTHSDVVLVDVQSRNVIYESTVLGGIKTAIDKGAKVVNVSIGDLSSCIDARSSRLASRQKWRDHQTAVMNYARQRDALVVWSAGSNCEKNDDQYLPAANPPAHRVGNWETHALVVGATTKDRKDACFSPMGDVVGLLAPGEDISFAPGQAPLDGTSFAAPLVAGAAGLVRAIEHTLSAEEARAMLLTSASRSVSLQSDALNGSRCAGEYPAGVTAENRPGAASTPQGMLNLQAAIESALVASRIPVITMPAVSLNHGTRERASFDVQIPETGVHSLDLVFLIDQSGSFEDDIDTLQSKADQLIKAVKTRGVDLRFGVAGFADYPTDGYGGTGDAPFTLYQDITDDVGDTKAAFEELDDPLMHGGDGPESQYQALDQATREFGWRTGALRVILLATDAPFHDSEVEPAYPGAGRLAVLAYLQEQGVVVIGLQSGDNMKAREQLQEVANATGGSLHGLDTSSSGIVEATSEGLDSAIDEVDVSVQILAGEPWVIGVVPRFRFGVAAEESVAITVHLEGILDNSIDPISQNVYVWVWGDKSALLSRTKIPLVVPSEPSWRLLE